MNAPEASVTALLLGYALYLAGFVSGLVIGLAIAEASRADAPRVNAEAKS